MWTGSEAQIYTCKGKDGSRVFSDEKCGPDAELVKGDYSKPKRPPPKGTSAKPVKTRRPASELEQLMLACDGGDMKACSAWTMGGGPELLQELAHVYLGPEVKFPPGDDPPAGRVVHIGIDRIAGVGPWTSG